MDNFGFESDDEGDISDDSFNDVNVNDAILNPYR